MPAETRLAHLTDLHVPLGMPRGMELLGKPGLSNLSWRFNRYKRHLPRVAEALITHLRARPHDLIAMAGDLINFGLEREFEAGRAWLDRLGPPDKVAAIPGNHEAMAGPWQEAMERHWGAYATPGRMLVHEGTALITVSSACVTPPFFASGRVATEEMARLTTNLAKAQAQALLPVVLIHHPPTEICVTRKALSNRQAVVRVLGAGGAAMVLHGHNHKNELSWIDAAHGRIPVLGAPSFSMASGGHLPPGAWREMVIGREAGAAWVDITQHTFTKDHQIVAETPVRLGLPVLA